MEIVSLQAEPGEIVPAAHVRTRRRQTSNLPKHFEEAVVLETEKAGVILVKLPFQRTFRQLHIGIREGREWGVYSDCSPIRSSPCRQGASGITGSSGCGGGSQESTAADGTIHSDPRHQKRFSSKRFPKQIYSASPAVVNRFIAVKSLRPLAVGSRLARSQRLQSDASETWLLR